MDGRSSWTSTRTNNRYSRTLPREQELFGKTNSFRHHSEYDFRNRQLYDEYKKTREIENELDEIIYVDSDELEDFLERNCLIYIEESDSEEEDGKDTDQTIVKDVDESSDSDDDSTSKSYISDEGEKPAPRILYRRLIIMEKEKVKINIDGPQEETEKENDELEKEDTNDLDDENIYTNQNKLYINRLFEEDILSLEEKIMKLQNINIQVIPPTEKLNLVLRSSTEANILLKHEAHELTTDVHGRKSPSPVVLKVHLVPSKGVIKSLSDSKVFEKMKISTGTENQNNSNLSEFSQGKNHISKFSDFIKSDKAKERTRRNSDEGAFEYDNQKEEIDIWAGRESPVSRVRAEPNIDDINENEDEDIDIWAGRKSPLSRIRTESEINDINDNQDDEIDIWAGRESPLSRIRTESEINDINDNQDDEIDIWSGRESPILRVGTKSNCDDINDSYASEIEDEEIDIWSGRESPLSKVRKRPDWDDSNNPSANESEVEEEIDIWSGKESPVSRIRTRPNCNDISDHTFESENQEEIDIWSGRESPISRVRAEPGCDDINDQTIENDDQEEEIDIWSGKESPISKVKSEPECDDINDHNLENENQEEKDIYSGRENPVSTAKTEIGCDETNDHNSKTENHEEIDIWSERKFPVSRVRSEPRCDDINDHTLENEDRDKEIDIWSGKESPLSKVKIEPKCDDINDNSMESENQEEEIDIWSGRESPISKVRNESECDDINAPILENENLEEEIDIWSGKESPVSKVKIESKFDGINDHFLESENQDEEIDTWSGRESPISRVRNESKCDNTNDNNLENKNQEEKIDIWSGIESPVSRVITEQRYDDINDHILENLDKEETEIWSGRESPLLRVKTEPKCDGINGHPSESEDQLKEMDIWSVREFPVSKIRIRSKYGDISDHTFENENEEETDFEEGRESLISSFNRKSFCDETSNHSSEDEKVEGENGIWTERKFYSSVSRVRKRSECYNSNEVSSDSDDSEEKIITAPGSGSPIPKVSTRPKYENADDSLSENENIEVEFDTWTEREFRTAKMEDINSNDSQKESQEKIYKCDDTDSNSPENENIDEKIIRVENEHETSFDKPRSKEDNFGDDAFENENSISTLNIASRVRILGKPIKVNDNNSENETESINHNEETEGRAGTSQNCGSTNNVDLENENPDGNITTFVVRIRARPKRDNLSHNNWVKKNQEEIDSSVEMQTSTSPVRSSSKHDISIENLEETDNLTPRERIRSRIVDSDYSSPQNDKTEEEKSWERGNSSFARVRKRPKYVERNNINPQNENMEDYDDHRSRKSSVLRVRTRNNYLEEEKMLNNESSNRNLEPVSKIHSCQVKKFGESSEDCDADKEEETETETKNDGETDCCISNIDYINLNAERKNYSNNFLSINDGSHNSLVPNIDVEKGRTFLDKVNDAEVKFAFKNIPENDKVDEYLNASQETQLQDSKIDSCNKKTSENILSKLREYKQILNIFNIPKNLNSHLTRLLESFNLISGNDETHSQFLKSDKELKDELNDIISDLDSSLVEDEISEQNIRVDNATKVECNLEKFNLLEEDLGN